MFIKERGWVGYRHFAVEFYFDDELATIDVEFFFCLVMDRDEIL